MKERAVIALQNSRRYKMETIRGSSSQKCCRQPLNRRSLTRRQCLLFLFTLLILQLVISNYSFYIYRTRTKDNMRQAMSYYDKSNMGLDGFNLTVMENRTVSYKYPMINATEVVMDFNSFNGSSYSWFMSKKNQFLDIGQEETPIYPHDTAICKINESSLGPIIVNKNYVELDWVEKQHPDIKPGGFYAPVHCRSAYRVAVIVPYRDRKKNLNIFLYYVHHMLKKQLLEYRIFVIEQYGTEKWNKGTLYNIAYLESQRFGTWDCLIFHDVDIIPEHEGIIYDCSGSPMHMAVAVESYGYVLPYRHIFGGVTALTPRQYESVNGYSNTYWNWGAEDDDMGIRLQYENYTVSRYNASVARYATLDHKRNELGDHRYFLLYLSHRYKMYKVEGLKTTKYNVIRVTKNKLYTHLLADVNPNKIKINTKIVLQQMVNMHGKSMNLRSIASKVLKFHRWRLNRNGDLQKNINQTELHKYFAYLFGEAQVLKLLHLVQH